MATGEGLGQIGKVPGELLGGKFKGTFKGKVHAVREDGTVSDGIFYSRLVGAVSCEEQKACVDDLVREGFHDLLPVADTLKWPLEVIQYARGRLLEAGYLSEAKALAEGYNL